MIGGLMLSGAAAHAAIDLALKVDASIGENSNVLRAVDSVTPILQASSPSGSFVEQRTLDASIGIPLVSDDTRLILTTQLGRNTINSFSDLSHTTHDTALQLPWRFGKLWEGSLARVSQKTPYIYDTDYRKIDMVKRDTTFGLLVLKVSPSLAFPMEAAMQTVRHEDLAEHGQSDEDRSRLGTAVRYTTPDGNSLQVGHDRSTSTFPKRTNAQTAFLDEGHSDSSSYLDLLWNYSAKTRLAWRTASQQRSHKNLTERNSHNVSTRLTLTHVLSPKTRIDVQIYRQPIESTVNNALYSTSQGLIVSGNWAYSPKTMVLFQAQRESQTDVLSPLAPKTSPGSLRIDRLGIRVQNAITRGVSVYLDAAHERRTQDTIGSARQTTVRLGVDYSFENIRGAQSRTRAPNVP